VAVIPAETKFGSVTRENYEFSCLVWLHLFFAEVYLFAVTLRPTVDSWRVRGAIYPPDSWVPSHITKIDRCERF